MRLAASKLRLAVRRKLTGLPCLSTARYGYGTEPYARNGIVTLSRSNGGNVPANLTSLHLGHLNGVEQLDGVISQVAIWPTALGDTDLSNLVL